MGVIYDAVNRSDMIVFATPLFFTTISSALKCVIDRFYALSSIGYDNVPKKEVALLVTAQENKPDTFYHVTNFYKALFVDSLRWIDRGMVLAGDCGGTQSPKRIKETKFLEEAKRFGSTLL